MYRPDDMYVCERLSVLKQVMYIHNRYSSYMYMLMRDAEGGKKEASKVIHSTPKAVTFPKEKRAVSSGTQCISKNECGPSSAW